MRPAPYMQATATARKRIQTHSEVASTRRRIADALYSRVRVAAGR
jgi:hypothetical protein